MSEDKEENGTPDAYISEKNVEKGADAEEAKARFINGGNTVNGGDTVVIVGAGDKQDESEFAGIGKEELLKYAEDPFWVRVRLGLFVTFWLAWFGMLAAAIVIIVLAPKCPPKPDLDWWQTDIMYQVYPRSFKDTDGDGVGDIKGIESKLDYLKKLGVGTLVIGPIYETGNVDWGYDVINHKAIDSKMGTMEDFDSLLKKAHKQRMKIILDFIPNHTSKKHKWFIESSKGNASSKYFDYYVWADDKNGNPPNNWLSKYSKKSAWTMDPNRKQYYYHTFFEEMPELNLRNPDVLKELDNILAFWLDKGVDGFRVGTASYLFESEDLADETSNGKTVKQPYDSLEHNSTTNQPESFNLTDRWMSLLDKWYTSDGIDQTRVLMVEAFGSPNETAGFYGNDELKGANLVLNRDLFKLDCAGKCVADLVEKSVSREPVTGKWSSWMVGGPDTPRFAGKMTPKYVNAVNTMLLTLPGTIIAYQGDELGMQGVDLSFSDTKDKWGINFGPDDYKLTSRDNSRSPMQWNGKYMAGFTNSTPWIPLGADYKEFNLMHEEAAGAIHKFPAVVRNLTTLRKEPSMLWGQYYKAEVNDNIFSYVRKAEGHPSYLVAINFGKDPSSDDYTKAVKGLVPEKGNVVFNTGNLPHGDFEPSDDPVALTNIRLNAGEAVIFSFPFQS